MPYCTGGIKRGRNMAGFLTTSLCFRMKIRPNSQDMRHNFRPQLSWPLLFSEKYHRSDHGGITFIVN